MADWNNNPAVGVAAGVVFILAMIMMALLLKPKTPAPSQNNILEIETPASAYNIGR